MKQKQRTVASVVTTEGCRRLTSITCVGQEGQEKILKITGRKVCGERTVSTPMCVWCVSIPEPLLWNAIHVAYST